jgi:hypothetical protein
MASSLITCRAAKAIIEAEITSIEELLQAKRSELAAINDIEMEMVENAAQEKEDIAREAIAEAAQIRSSIFSAKTVLPVFCTADEAGLRTGNISLSDFNDFVAFSYQVKVDLTHAFDNMTEDDFKKYLTTLHRCDSGEKITPAVARKICNAMNILTYSAGKYIVVAVAGSKGGGLEIRRITGLYRYSENFHAADGTICYFHQFPTEFVRTLTPEESKAVTEARTDRYALNWNSPPISIMP